MDSKKGINYKEQVIQRQNSRMWRRVRDKKKTHRVVTSTLVLFRDRPADVVAVSGNGEFIVGGQHLPFILLILECKSFPENVFLKS